VTLADLFASLTQPVRDTDLPSFSTVVIGNGPHRLGKGVDGAPALLVSLPSGGPVGTPVELEHISVQQGIRCLLWRPGAEPEVATVALVRCRGIEPFLLDYFLGVIEGVLPLLGPTPSEGRVREVVTALTELFRALELPPRKTIQGLWGELYVIAQSSDVMVLLDAWHIDPAESYDFSGPGQRIEVKSAAGTVRSHIFSLAQLDPPGGAAAIVASLFVERAGGGVSLGELLEEVRQRLSARPDLAIRLDQVVSASLGQSWRNGLAERFDRERAQESLAFFDVGTIPSIQRIHVPASVSEVKFRSELMRVQPLSEGAVRQQGGLFQAVLPRRVSARR
jgi:hypothetical protein